MFEVISEAPGLVWLFLSALGGGVAGIGIKHLLCNQNEDRYASFIEQMKDGYYRSSLDGKQLSANPGLYRLNGYSSEREQLDAVEDIETEWYVDPNRRKEFAAQLEEFGRVDDFKSEIYRHKTRERIWISENARLVYTSSGQPSYYEGTVTEITDTVKRLELESSYRKFSENVPGAMFQAKVAVDGSFSLPFYSKGLFGLFGDIGDVSLKQDATSLLAMIPEEHRQAYLDAVDYSRRNSSPLNHEFPIKRKDRSIIWLGMKATPETLADDATLWHGFLMDVTDRKKSEVHIHRLAYYDPLTKLANRRLLTERLKLSMSKCRVKGGFGCLIFIDLDNFKVLNDARGHSSGDQLLVEIAEILENCVDDKGSVFRFGGDEFVILLENLGDDETLAMKASQSLTNNILAGVDQPIEIEGEKFQTSCSIGVTLFSDSDEDLSDVMRRADSAMYASKDNGKGRVTYYDSVMLESLDQTMKLMNQLREASSKNELSLYYQMQVDQDGVLVGAEALLRWHHPVLGVVPPDQFIPIAEQNGVIVPVTEWTMEEALRTLGRWRHDDALKGIKLSLNISARQFHEPDFVSRIKQLVVDHQADPSKLVLEMTEHVLNHDTELVADVMNALREIGIGFSLDDFGTGYSSLVHMRELPLCELKIDGKFISDLEDNPEDRAIIRSIIAMAEALELETVAEWVETKGQQEYLKSVGCTRLQGYLFGPAVPLAEFEYLAHGDHQAPAAGEAA